MRNKYSKEFEEEMYKKASKKTIKQLLEIANKKYNYPITKNSLMDYLSKREIRYKGYNPNKAKAMGNIIPIGTERRKNDGMVLVKVTPNKWKYKQRLIYEQHYGVTLKDDEYVIFLDHNRNNFDISNLKLISRKDSSTMSNQGLFSNNPIATETGYKVVQLMNKIRSKSEKMG